MTDVKVIDTGISGLYIIEPTIFSDDRGDFFETYTKEEKDEEYLWDEEE